MATQRDITNVKLYLLSQVQNKILIELYKEWLNDPSSDLFDVWKILSDANEFRSFTKEELIEAQKILKDHKTEDLAFVIQSFTQITSTLNVCQSKAEKYDKLKELLK